MRPLLRREYSFDPQESRFIERLRGRDERAFNELVEQYEQRVFRLMFRMLARRDEAEDMVQEVFVRAFKAIETFRGESKLSTWIYRIAVNLCKNRAKYLSRRRSDAQDEFEHSAEWRPMQEGNGVTVGETTRPDQVVQGYQLERIVRVCIAELILIFARHSCYVTSRICLTRRSWTSPVYPRARSKAASTARERCSSSALPSVWARRTPRSFRSYEIPTSFFTRSRAFG